MPGNETDKDEVEVTVSLSVKPHAQPFDIVTREHALTKSIPADGTFAYHIEDADIQMDDLVSNMHVRLTQLENFISAKYGKEIADRLQAVEKRSKYLREQAEESQ